jgi:hypothetical protein
MIDSRNTVYYTDKSDNPSNFKRGYELLEVLDKYETYLSIVDDDDVKVYIYLYLKTDWRMQHSFSMNLSSYSQNDSMSVEVQTNYLCAKNE